jgi:hypothetical protein
MMELLFKEIANASAKYTDVQEFTKTLKLVVDTINLPNELYYGTVWLIKNKTIISITSGFSYESYSLNYSGGSVEYQGTISPIKIHYNDIPFKNKKQFDYDIEVRSLDYIEKFVIILLKHKFSLYVNR